MNPGSVFDNEIICKQDTELDKMLAEMPGKPGVCLLTAAGDRPILLLNGNNIRLIAKRRLERNEEEGKTKKANLRPLITKIYFKNCFSKFETQLDYFEAALKIYPSSWQNLFPKLSSWYLLLDRSGAVPIFKTVKKYEPAKGNHWGPFATKSNAERMLEAITVIHKLCRCSNNLIYAPDATPCSYAQMDLCMKVCDGTTSFEDYEKLISKSISFLNEPIQISIDSIEEQIRELSIQLKFEEAEKLHRVATECKKIAGRAYKWIGPMENFRILSFQPGPKFKSEGKGKEPGICPVVISSAEGIKKLEPFAISETEAKSKMILESLSKSSDTEKELSISHETQYMLAWITQLISRSDKQQGVFVNTSETLSAQGLTETIKKHFS